MMLSDLDSLTAPGGAELPPIMLPRIKLLRRSIASFFKVFYADGFTVARDFQYLDPGLVYVEIICVGLDTVARSLS